MQGARNQAKQAQCLANMREMGSASLIYASENRDVRVQGDDRDPSGVSTTHFVTSMLPGLGYPENVDELFQRVQNGGTFTEALHLVCKKVKILQCPSYPDDDLSDLSGRSADRMEQQSLDYVVNAFPIPYRFSTFGAGALSTVTGPGPAGAPGGVQPSFFFKPAKAGRADLSRTIYITEAHARMRLPTREGLPWDINAYWGELIDVFIPNHIPFGGAPRVAKDMRHPRGITSMFFDGHAEALRPITIDPGLPNTVNNIYDRCRRFTYSEAEPP
jgi:hypothetical protein